MEDFEPEHIFECGKPLGGKEKGMEAIRRYIGEK